jgi:choline transport protein
MAVCALAVLFNTVGAKHLPLFEILILVLHVVGFIGILVTLGALAPKTDAKTVFTSFSNFGGWSSVGAACVASFDT